MKITALLSLTLLSAGIYAQSVLTDRHRFGISATAGLNFTRTNSDYLEVRKTLNAVRSFGGIYEYQYSDLLSFRGGISLETCKSYLSDNPADGIALYELTAHSNGFNESPLNYEDLVEHDNEFSGTPAEVRQFYSRRNRFRYFTFPLEVVLRTRMKSFTRYYAKGGIKPQLCVARKAFERSSYPFSDYNYELYDKVRLRDVRTWNAALTFGIGAEHVISTKTSVYFDIEFNLALLDTFRQSQREATLYVGNGTAPTGSADVQGSQDFRSNSLIQNQLQVKIGIFF